MSSHNVKVGFRDFSQEVDWGGGRWREDYPAKNAGNTEHARVARSEDLDTESTRLHGELPVQRPIQLIGIVLPNASISAEFRLVRYDYFGDEIDDTGFKKIYPEVYNVDSMVWEDERFWTQSYTQEEILRMRFCRPYDTEDYRLTKEIDLEFRDPENDDGFLDVSYIALAESWQLSVNINYGATHEFESRSKVVQARGGAKAFDRLPKPRRFSGSIDYLPHDEAMDKVYELQRQLDVTDAFLFHPYPEEPQQWLRTTFIARQRQLNPIERAVYGHDTVQLELEEVM